MNVHKSPTEKCDDVSEYSYENVNGGDFDTNINRDMCMKVNVSVYRYKAAHYR